MNFTRQEITDAMAEQGAHRFAGEGAKDTLVYQRDKHIWIFRQRKDDCWKQATFTCPEKNKKLQKLVAELGNLNTYILDYPNASDLTLKESQRNGISREIFNIKF